ncbi:MAG: 16S rRNA (cytidine(1402)-2'-O)-methyltransferase [Candidatus Eisenbacteria sp.]|nr:16S rRNA (cytidine(1402)-2'-O)-methyltransferase [Candidatus Eisenbacteria bacterium]
MATLYVVATPIGNLEDITFRAVRILREIGTLACEDTRTTRKILQRYEIPRPARMIAYHEHNEQRVTSGIMRLLDRGEDVALCSDAGYPGISDPGYRVIAAAAEQGHRIEVIPGAGAVQPALLASGLPSTTFTFKGFPPRRTGARRKFLLAERDSIHTLVFFESPRRVHGLLKDALSVLGDRRAAVCIELTKKFEEVHRGWLGELSAQFIEARIRGEATVVIAGHHPKFMRVSS